MNEKLERLNRIEARIAWMEDAAANGPENLYCDGERSREDVDAEFRDLYRERSHLKEQLNRLENRPVSADGSTRRYLKQKVTVRDLMEM